MSPLNTFAQATISRIIDNYIEPTPGSLIKSSTKTILEKAAELFKQTSFTMSKPSPVTPAVLQQLKQRAEAVKNAKLIRELSEEEYKQMNDILEQHSKTQYKY